MKSYNKGSKITAVILAAGTGSRMALGYNKMFLRIGELTMLEMTVNVFKKSELIDEIICATNPGDELEYDQLDLEGVRFVTGGLTRTESVRNALEVVDGDVVLIHDGARPFVTSDVIKRVIASAQKFGSGVPITPMADTVKRVYGDTIVGSPDRKEFFCAQTPQAYKVEQIKSAYYTVMGDFTDDSEVYRMAGYEPRVVEGCLSNRKITTHADLLNSAADYKIGYGYDVHRLVENRDLILGGVYVPYEKGLEGHSDADVLTHAVMDALLSAIGLPDIGVLFPDTDPAYEGISSLVLLEKVMKEVRTAHATVKGVSCVIMAEKPRLAGYIKRMRECLARTMHVAPDIINISATTTEKLGVVGDGKGIAATAVAFLGF